MKIALPLIMAALLLLGCDKTQGPKLPPKVPEPKASVADFAAGDGGASRASVVYTGQLEARSS